MIVDEGHIQVSFARDVAEARYRPTDSASASLPARSRRLLTESDGVRGTVEVYRAVGGLPQRALLGGVLRPSSDGRTTVQVSVADLGEGDPETPTCPGALGHDLVPGLPAEFAGAVVTTAVSLLWGPGLLQIDRGAYDPVQSSELAFALATRMLVEALRLGANADDNTIVEGLRTVAQRLEK